MRCVPLRKWLIVSGGHVCFAYDIVTIWRLGGLSSDLGTIDGVAMLFGDLGFREFLSIVVVV